MFACNGWGKLVGLGKERGGLYHTRLELAFLGFERSWIWAFAAMGSWGGVHVELALRMARGESMWSKGRGHWYNFCCCGESRESPVGGWWCAFSLLLVFIKRIYGYPRREIPASFFFLLLSLLFSRSLFPKIMSSYFTNPNLSCALYGNFGREHRGELDKWLDCRHRFCSC